MSQSRFFQRFSRSSSRFYNTVNQSPSYHSQLWNRVGKTSALISCGLVAGYTIQCNDTTNLHMCLASPITGTVYSWGFNRYGQLGVGSENNENLPTKIDGLHNIVFVSCGQ